MDHIAVKEYVLVYFHTLTSDYNHLDSDFLKKLYDVVDIKLVHFGNCLDSFYLYIFNTKQ
jgi:hypothetical protein